MPSQNFRVKNGLEVGTNVTISAGIITATSASFSGNVNIDGNIGIGSTIPATKLDVDGDVNISGYLGVDGILYKKQTPIYFDENNLGEVQIVGSGNNLKFYNPVFGPGGDWIFDTYSYGEVVRITNSGNVGIGTTIPSAKLHLVGTGTTTLLVDGNARITGILTIGQSSVTLDGTNNQINVGAGLTLSHSNGVLLGSTRLHSAGLDVDEIKVGTGITIRAGIISATEFRGNGSFLTGVTPFSSGTLMLFQQTAAPTGWTKQTTHNDKTLRVVSGNASSGGTTAFTSVFTSRSVSGSVDNTTLSTVQMPSHSHSVTTNYSFQNGGGTTSSNNSYTYNTGGTNSAGSSNAHSHGFTGTAMDFAVQYVDLIIASKD